MYKQLSITVISLSVTFGTYAQWTGQSSSTDLASPISRTGSVMTTNMFINDGVNGAQIRLNSNGTYYGKIGNPTPQVWSLGWGGSVLDINPVLNWTAAGNVGIGTIAPSFKLDVSGNIVNSNPANGWIGLTGDLPGYSNGAYGTLRSNATFIYFSGGGKYSGYLGGTADAIFGLNNSASDVKVQLNTNGNSYFTGGNVGIGTMSPDAKLAVSGLVHAQEVKVSLTVPGPDYVFEKDYRLPALEEVKSYIDQNKHLPEVPSAAEMEKNGVQLGEMNMLLLKKVEEMTLYVIELKKEIDELKSAKPIHHEEKQ